MSTFIVGSNDLRCGCYIMPLYLDRTLRQHLRARWLTTWPRRHVSLAGARWAWRVCRAAGRQLMR